MISNHTTYTAHYSNHLTIDYCIATGYGWLTYTLWGK